MSIPAPFLFAIQAVSALAGAGATVAGQSGMAKAQAASNAEAVRNNNRALAENYESLQIAAQQERAASEAQIDENRREALAARETAKVAAAAAGVSGFSVDALLGDLYGQEARFADSVRGQFDNTQAQLAAEGRGMAGTTRARNASLPAIQRPDYITAGTKAGTGVWGAYRDHLKIRPEDV